MTWTTEAAHRTDGGLCHRAKGGTSRPPGLRARLFQRRQYPASVMFEHPELFEKAALLHPSFPGSRKQTRAEGQGDPDHRRRAGSICPLPLTQRLISYFGQAGKPRRNCLPSRRPRNPAGRAAGAGAIFQCLNHGAGEVGTYESRKGAGDGVRRLLQTASPAPPEASRYPGLARGTVETRASMRSPLPPPATRLAGRTCLEPGAQHAAKAGSHRMDGQISSRPISVACQRDPSCR